MHLRLLLALLFLFALPATAAYKWTMPDGSVVFSDQPPHPDAEKIILPKTQTFTPPPIPKIAPQKKPETKVATTPPYSSLQITLPAHDQTIHDNSGKISVSVVAEPALSTTDEHQIMIELDGVSTITTAAMQAVLTNVDRGRHTLRAHIIDKEGTSLISTKENTFHLRRVSVLH